MGFYQYSSLWRNRVIFQVFMRIFLIIFLLSCLLCGCGKQQDVIPPQADKLRILSLVTCADHIITELGAKDKIIAIDRHGKVLDSMQNVPVAAAGSTVSREFLKKHRINCAVVWYYQIGLQELLRKEKIYTIVIKPITPGNYPETVRTLGRLCNKKEQAERLIADFKKQIDAVPAAAARKSVYFELYAPWKTPAQSGYISLMVQQAGGYFAAAAPHGGTVSPEAVCTALPEVIFYVENFGDPGEIASRPALRNTPAVKNNRIYAVPRQLACEGVDPENLLKFLSRKLKDI